MLALAQAIENYTYATEMDPKNHIYMTNRSLCYASMKNYAKSLRDADKAIAIKGDWEKGWYRRGVALSNLERYEEAMTAFQKCLDLNPSSKDYQQQYDQAKRDLYKGLSESEILKMEGNEVSPRKQAGMKVERRNSNAQKVGMLTSDLRSCFSSGVSRASRSQLFKRGKIPEAIAQYTKALDKGQTHTHAQPHLTLERR